MQAQRDGRALGGQILQRARVATMASTGPTTARGTARRVLSFRLDQHPRRRFWKRWAIATPSDSGRNSTWRHDRGIYTGQGTPPMPAPRRGRAEMKAVRHPALSVTPMTATLRGAKIASSGRANVKTVLGRFASFSIRLLCHKSYGWTQRRVTRAQNAVHATGGRLFRLTVPVRVRAPPATG